MPICCLGLAQGIVEPTNTIGFAMTPPWASFVTATPQPFSYGIRDGQLVVVAGTESNMVFCRVGLQTGLVCHGRKGAEPVVVDAYTLKLESWRPPALPILDLHPFALAHLLATGQMDRNELLMHVRRAFNDNYPCVRATLAVTVPCNLLRVLQRSRMAIRLATSAGI